VWPVSDDNSTRRGGLAIGAMRCENRVGLVGAFCFVREGGARREDWRDGLVGALNFLGLPLVRPMIVLVLKTPSSQKELYPCWSTSQEYYRRSIPQQNEVASLWSLELSRPGQCCACPLLARASWLDHRKSLSPEDTTGLSGRMVEKAMVCCLVQDSLLTKYC
jgi:hypothetical protein